MSIDLAVGLDLRILEALAIVLLVIVIDFLVGFVKGIATTGFSAQKFPGQLVSFVLPYFVPLFALAAWVWITPFLNVVGVTGGFAGTFFTAAAAVTIKAIADIGIKLGVNFTPTATANQVVVVTPAAVPLPPPTA